MCNGKKGTYVRGDGGGGQEVPLVYSVLYHPFSFVTVVASISDG